MKIARPLSVLTEIPTLLFCMVFLAGAAPAYEVALETGSVFDPGRSREIAYSLYFPEDFSGIAPVLLFSHGGAGTPFGHTLYPHYGEHWAAAGYIGLHVNHLPSAIPGTHRIDRPADVSFILDALQSGELEMPAAFLGTPRLDQFGHAGHSFGAYTSMALAGGDFLLAPDFRDDRIVAIAPISPQGPGQFGAYDNGPSDNTWAGVEIPSLNIVGEAEKDTNALGTIFEIDWRLRPFERFPAIGDKFQAVLPGQDHADVGASPEATIAAYLGENTRRFFDVYLKGETDEVCLIGRLPSIAGQELEGRPDLVANVAAECPPPIGVPEAGFPASVALAAGGLIWMRRSAG